MAHCSLMLRDIACFYLAAKRVTYNPYNSQLGGPFREIRMPDYTTQLT